ncbi:nuclear protein qri2 [Grosmannia clavigera kw1407]|uniref:Non-structural maintenance of chromosomes element 4 n=1 Tax=Grosmannia clavigera (strain kw1407 / UAMH 11150) TaxID=655863 RepID=F0XGE6_GROCL|nr:nuclear protein qri2 [Grosmannia clavigera kw1407]EFX03057.1 nuclear protein qri2 [Grosmannia clavigera kw1407]
MTDMDMTQDSWDGANTDQMLGVEQSLEDRRRLQQGFRSLIKQTTTDQTRFLDAKAEALHTVLEESDTLLQRTKQTSEAAIDAALVIRISELAYKRTTHFLADRADDSGVNLEDFVSRCKDYMQFGRGIDDEGSPDLSREQRRRRKVEAAAHRQGGREEVHDGNEEDEAQGTDDDDDEAGTSSSAAKADLDWTHFGQYACLPHVRRPGLARFLPRATLAGDEKTRVVMRKRTAALRLNELQEVRPQVLRPGDLNVSQNSDLTALATDILQQLRRAAEHGQAKVQRAYEQAGGDGDDEDDEALLRRLMDRYGIRSDGGVDLIRFAINPRSFAQTVENFFYISFLVRDGRVGLAYDDNGLPSIYPISEEDTETAKDSSGPEEDTRKHQLILSMDMAMWRDVIETFNIKKPMIAHREIAGEKHPNGRAWFT